MIEMCIMMGSKIVIHFSWNSFFMEGKVITLVPLSPKEVHEDQLKIKGEIGQSSGDGRTKQRVERVAYCSNQPLLELEPNDSFEQKTEEELSKPFHNMQVKIRDRILFKRRGMMQSEVLYKVWSHVFFISDFFINFFFFLIRISYYFELYILILTDKDIFIS